MNHPLPETLAAFVMGGTTPAEERDLELHLASCASCAAALATEARLEEVVQATASHRRVHPAPRPRPASRRRLWATLAATPVAAAAAWLMVAGTRVTPERAPTAISTATTAAVSATALTTCARGAGQRRCVRAAHKHGLAVQTGTRVLVPRYERSLWPAFDLQGVARP
jgi:hypothetical protein